MKNLPLEIKTPSIESSFSIEVNSRGKLWSKPKSVQKVFVPGGKKNFNLYRQLAKECVNIPICIYRENVEVAVELSPRPIRLDAILQINDEVILLDTALSKSELARAHRKCEQIIQKCKDITKIGLLLKENLITLAKKAKWSKPIHIVKVIDK